MNAYAVVGNKTAAATKSVLDISMPNVVGPSPELFYVCVSSKTAPADVALDMRVARFTAGGTATLVTPEPLKGSNRAAISIGGSNHSGEPTYAGVNYLNVAFNQRSVYQWYAFPDGELSAPIGADDGIGLQIVAVNGGTPELNATFHFKE